MNEENTNTDIPENQDLELGNDPAQTGTGEPPKDNEGGDPAGSDPKDDNGEAELFGKPESYDYKEVKLPEGMNLNEDMTGKFNDYASKMNLSQKGANDLMAMAVELTEQTQKQTVAQLNQLNEAKIENYKQLLNADKEVGGAKLKETLTTANLAYEAFADEPTRELLAESGLTVHPKIVKMFHTIGLQMKQDNIHISKNPVGDKRTREDILYPSMNKGE